MVKKVLIIGAGQGGKLLASEILATQEYDILGFLDDDKKLFNTKIYDHKVLGNINSLSKLALALKPEEIFIAIPSLQGEKLEKIISEIQGLNLKIQIMPGIFESINYQTSKLVPAGKLRPLEIGDLLDRQKIILDIENISRYLSNKVILITGAGGSIGSELTRRISEYNPKRLILLDNYENHLYELQQELNNPNNRYIIADIKEKIRLNQIFKKYKPEIIFHAAAHKHVPLMETEPQEAVKNNILGSSNLIELAVLHDVERFIFISTDKAICPTSIMGATKRFTENQILSTNAPKIVFAIVRFGNVLGSFGSVIPLWQKQLLMGKSISVTDKKMTRFFMTIPEAVQLVIQAGAMAKNSSIFVLKMGKPYKIIDLAEKFLRLSGFNPDTRIDITGIRPGEKLNESLNEEEEKIEDSDHPMIMEIKKNRQNFQKIKEILSIFEKEICQLNQVEIEELLKKAIPTYQEHQAMKKPKISSNVIHFSPPYLGREEAQAVSDVVKSGWLTTGSKTQEFEKNFALYHQTDFALAVNSATAGLHLSMLSLGIGPGDEVIVPSYTFAACANTVCWAGAKPVFADITKTGFLIDPIDIERKITKKTKAIMVVHFGGQMAQMDSIGKIAKAHNLKIIEDCAHSPGAKFDGRLAGTIGDAGVFSFYANKNMTTAEGGMVITKNAEMAEKIQVLRLHGMSKDAFDRYSKSGSWAYEITEAGFKCNLTDLASSIGLIQLRKLDQMNKKRAQVARNYSDSLSQNDHLELPTILPNRESVWHLFPILVDPKRRNKIIEQLKDFNIITSVHFIPLHLQPFYRRKFGYNKGDLPISEQVFEREISLPMHPGLEQEQISYISQVINYLLAE